MLKSIITLLMLMGIIMLSNCSAPIKQKEDPTWNKLNILSNKSSTEMKKEKALKGLYDLNTELTSPQLKIIYNFMLEKETWSCEDAGIKILKRAKLVNPESYRWFRERLSPFENLLLTAYLE
jgi:hypothetical protein